MKRVHRILSCPIYLTLVHQIEGLEINRQYCRHGLSHSLDVARIAYLMALENNLVLEKELIYAAGLLHDIGRAFPMAKDHSSAGKTVTQNILEKSGFTTEETAEIIRAILQHRGHCHKDTDHTLSSLLKKADKLSRNCFLCAVKERCHWPEDKKNETVTY